MEYMMSSYIFDPVDTAGGLGGAVVAEGHDALPGGRAGAGLPAPGRGAGPGPRAGPPAPRGRVVALGAVVRRRRTLRRLRRLLDWTTVRFFWLRLRFTGINSND